MPSITVWLLQGVIFLYVAIVYGKYDIIEGRGKRIYGLINGTRYAIPDYETFSLIQPHIGTYRKVSDGDLAKIPEDETVRLISDLSDSHRTCPCTGDISQLISSRHVVDTKVAGSSNQGPTQQSRSNLHHLQSVHHRLCIINSTFSHQLINNFRVNISTIQYHLVSHSNSHAQCDLLLDIIPPQPIYTPSGSLMHGEAHKTTNTCHSIKYICPESCLPHVYVAIPYNWLTDSFIWTNVVTQTDLLLTCTLSLRDLMSLPTSNVHHDMSHHIRHHTMISYLIKQIMKRRLEECDKLHKWPRSKAISTDSNSHSVSQPAARALQSLSGLHPSESETYLIRRKVFGLIIWIGSLSRIDMVVQQMQVLQLQFKFYRDRKSDRIPPKADAWDEYIAGWIATEDVYPCRNGSSRANNMYPNFAYYQFSNMNRQTLGWTCAQRRPLRALGHALRLFDPEFVLLVDDDTFVNMDLLIPHDYTQNVENKPHLSKYIQETMHQKAIVLGQLYNLYKQNVGKFSRKGFYLGGAGYLLGKAALNRLVSHDILGPPSSEDSNRDSIQTKYLSILREAHILSQQHCQQELFSSKSGDRAFHQCLEVTKGNLSDNVIGSSGVSSVRLLDLCVNMLSGEKTSYHSDYAMTRCLVHGAYIDAVHIDCETASSLQKVGNTDIMLSMCHFDKGCKVASQNHILTCHRYVAKRETNGSFSPASTASWKDVADVKNTQSYLKHAWC